METVEGRLILERCVKCGERDPHLEYRGQVAGHDLSQIKFVGGYLIASCRRCGYEWEVKPLATDRNGEQ